MFIEPGGDAPPSVQEGHVYRTGARDAPPLVRSYVYKRWRDGRLSANATFAPLQTGARLEADVERHTRRS